MMDAFEKRVSVKTTPVRLAALLLLSVFATAMQLQAGLNFIWDLHDKYACLREQVYLFQDPRSTTP